MVYKFNSTRCEITNYTKFQKLKTFNMCRLKKNNCFQKIGLIREKCIYVFYNWNF